jgi:hypothetical protein
MAHVSGHARSLDVPGLVYRAGFLDAAEHDALVEWLDARARVVRRTPAARAAVWGDPAVRLRPAIRARAACGVGAALARIRISV